MANCDLRIIEKESTSTSVVYICARCGSKTKPVPPGKIRIECKNPDGQPQVKGPSLGAKVTHYAVAVKRWSDAGYPVRTDEEVEHIFREHCSQCKWYEKGVCQHEDCGCAVGPPDQKSILYSIANAIGIRAPAEAMTNKIKMATETCPIGKWSTVRWVTNADRAQATIKLIGMLPPTITGVAGISRSGLSSAMQIAEMLHLHPYVVQPDGTLTDLPSGYRFQDAKPDTGDLLVVDDTVASGTSMRGLKEAIAKQKKNRNVITAVTYASVEARHLVDLYAEQLDTPHYLEWNFFNSIYSPHTALDFDGIICCECDPSSDDDGVNYEEFVKNAKPMYVTRRTSVPLIVTARLEKYRKDTEEWLAKWGITCDKLVMGPWESIEERRAKFSAAEFKGKAYAESSCIIFVESCPIQARNIFKATNKTVICPRTREVHRP